MPITWDTAFANSLHRYFYMGEPYEALSESDRVHRGYLPAKYRFEQIPSLRTRDGGRVLDDEINRYALGALRTLEFNEGNENAGTLEFGLGYALTLTIRYYIEHGGAPIVPEASQIAARQASIIGRNAFESVMFTPQRGLLSDLPLQVQNIILGADVMPPNAGRPTTHRLVSLDGAPTIVEPDAPSPFLKHEFTPSGTHQHSTFIATTLELDPHQHLAYIQITPSAPTQNPLNPVIPWLTPFNPNDIEALTPSAAGNIYTATNAALLRVGPTGSYASQDLLIGRQAAKLANGNIALNIAGYGRSNLFTNKTIRIYW